MSTVIQNINVFEIVRLIFPKVIFYCHGVWKTWSVDFSFSYLFCCLHWIESFFPQFCNDFILVLTVQLDCRGNNSIVLHLKWWILKMIYITLAFNQNYPLNRFLVLVWPCCMAGILSSNLHCHQMHQMIEEYLVGFQSKNFIWPFPPFQGKIRGLCSWCFKFYYSFTLSLSMLILCCKSLDAFLLISDWLAIMWIRIFKQKTRVNWTVKVGKGVSMSTCYNQELVFRNL